LHSYKELLRRLSRFPAGALEHGMPTYKLTTTDGKFLPPDFIPLNFTQVWFLPKTSLNRDGKFRGNKELTAAWAMRVSLSSMWIYP